MKLFKLFITIFIFAFLLRFIGPNWDDKFFFHPDERNVVDAVMRIDLTKGKFDPDFYAYGTFPIYLTKLLTGPGAEYKQTFVALRFESTLASTSCVLLTFEIIQLMQKRFGKKQALIPYLGATLIAFSPGMIQFAHFGTFETFLTTEYLLIFFLILKWLESQSKKFLFWISVIIGLSISTKIINLFLIPLPLVLLIYGRILDRKKLSLRIIPKYILNLLIAAAIFLLTSPYYILNWKGFMGSLDYEGSVANGTTIVFYTQQFINSVPVLYQLMHVFPYILGFGVVVLFLISLIYGLFWAVRYWRNLILVCILAYIPIAYAVFNFTLYVKWTRYMIPLIPFCIILVALFTGKLYSKIKKLRPLLNIIFLFVISLTIYEGLSVSLRYVVPDPRIELADWVKNNTSPDNTICTELADIGIIPMEGMGRKMNPIDLYYIEDKFNTFSEFEASLSKCDYFVSLSNRIYSQRFRYPSKYPISYEFYNKLNRGELEFTFQIAFSKTFGTTDNKIDISTQNVLYPDETFNVFDNPTVIVYKKNG